MSHNEPYLKLLAIKSSFQMLKVPDVFSGATCNNLYYYNNIVCSNILYYRFCKCTLKNRYRNLEQGLCVKIVWIFTRLR